MEAFAHCAIIESIYNGIRNAFTFKETIALFVGFIATFEQRECSKLIILACSNICYSALSVVLESYP